MGVYQKIVVEVFRSHGETGRHEIRLRPIAGQCFSPEKRVECSSKLRTVANIGKLFLMPVKEKDAPQYSNPPLYCPPSWKIQEIGHEESKKYCSAKVES